MITHYIIMSSSYSKGKRIALDYTFENESNYLKLKEVLGKITEKCGKDVSISTHFIQTNSPDWHSVGEKDYFFRDVEKIDNIDEFIKLINQDRSLKGIDIAKYILSKTKCTHMKLEKLVYFCFAEYLCQYNKELYEDDIYAYKWGPVVKSVYSRYKGYKEIETEDIDASDVFEMPARSRILFAEDGVRKMQIIDEVIKKYGNLLASDLVKLTHRDFTPWYVSGQGELNNEVITNEVIKKYHCNETS